MYEKKNISKIYSLPKKNEFPSLYFKEFLEFTGFTEKEFWDIADSWRNKNLWHMQGNDWVKKFPIN